MYRGGQMGRCVGKSKCTLLLFLSYPNASLISSQGLSVHSQDSRYLSKCSTYSHQQTRHTLWFCIEPGCCLASVFSALPTRLTLVHCHRPFFFRFQSLTPSLLVHSQVKMSDSLDIFHSPSSTPPQKIKFTLRESAELFYKRWKMEAMTVIFLGPVHYPVNLMFIKRGNLKIEYERHNEKWQE